MFFFFSFQVSYIYALSVFEDHLYATHSDHSTGSSSMKLIRIHRFNITAESKTLATLGNSKQLRVYHKLTQPKGNLAIYTCECTGVFLVSHLTSFGLFSTFLFVLTHSEGSRL